MDDANPRRVRQSLSWTATAAVWCSVLAAAVTVALDTVPGTIAPGTAAALGSLGAACAGSLMWRAAKRIEPGRRTTYQLMAAGIQTMAASFAAACWLPDAAGDAVAGSGFAAAVVLWALALLRLPDRGWAPRPCSGASWTAPSSACACSSSPGPCSRAPCSRRCAAPSAKATSRSSSPG
nr:hypothetical protein GCM10025732_53060 [Glycomyces mayteni]